MIRLLRVRHFDEETGKCQLGLLVKDEFETAEEARDYYQELYKCKILLDYETVK